MAQDDAGGAGAERGRALDIGLGQDAERHGARGAGEDRHRDHADGDDDVLGVGAEDRHHRQREDDVGEAQHDVDGSHQQGLDPATPPGREDPERHADQEGDGDTADADAERRARADQDAAEDVAAELVGAEPMCGGRRAQGLREVLAEGILGRQHRP